MEQFLYIVLGLVALWVFFFICIGLPFRMAQRRNKNPYLWVLISLLFTPALAILLLLALDDRSPRKPE